MGAEGPERGTEMDLKGCQSEMMHVPKPPLEHERKGEGKGADEHGNCYEKHAKMEPQTMHELVTHVQTNIEKGNGQNVFQDVLKCKSRCLIGRFKHFEVSQGECATLDIPQIHIKCDSNIYLEINEQSSKLMRNSCLTARRPQ